MAAALVPLDLVKLDERSIGCLVELVCFLCSQVWAFHVVTDSRRGHQFVSRDRPRLLDHLGLLVLDKLLAGAKVIERLVGCPLQARLAKNATVWLFTKGVRSVGDRILLDDLLCAGKEK